MLAVSDDAPRSFAKPQRYPARQPADRFPFAIYTSFGVSRKPAMERVET
jgi:hypothetical protein